MGAPSDWHLDGFLPRLFSIVYFLTEYSCENKFSFPWKPAGNFRSLGKNVFNCIRNHPDMFSKDFSAVLKRIAHSILECLLFGL